MFPPDLWRRPRPSALRAGLLAAFLGALLLGPVSAQPLTPGTQIRLYHGQGRPIVGTLLEIGRDTLWVWSQEERERAGLSLASIDRIETRVRASRASGAWRWARRGFLAGAAAGSAVCLADPEPCRSRPDEGAAAVALESGLFVGTGVAMLGAATGALFPGRRWVRVDPPYPTVEAPPPAGRAPAQDPGTAAPASAPPREASGPRREGFWIGVGGGPSHSWIGCRACGPRVENDPWDGGLGASLSVAMGGTVSPALLLGGELSTWGSTRAAEGPSGEDRGERRATVIALSALAHYYPRAGRRLYLRGGLGLGGALLETAADGGGLQTLESTGLGLQGGIGYDVPLGRRLAFSPQVTYVQIIGRGEEAEIAGQRVAAPGHPSYLTVGAALTWY